MAFVGMLDIRVKTFILFLFVVISYLAFLLKAWEKNRSNLGNSFLIN
jgi:hypothetical protein